MENTVNQWADAIASLPEKQFFNIIRLYLGEVKTPFNKQKLASQLASFVLKTTNLENIVNYLDAFDISVLTAISVIPNVNQQMLIDFFSGECTYSEIYSEVENLTERLIIYSAKNPITGKEVLLINPLLEKTIKPLLHLNYILQPAQKIEFSYGDNFLITPNFLFSFICYLKIHGCSCKADGLIKKNTMSKFMEIFGNKQRCLQLLVNAFVNLSILLEGEKSLELDVDRLNAFVALSFEQQLALLCAASCSRFSREGLKKQAVLLLDCLKSIPESGYTRNTILRLAFLVGSYTNDGGAVAKRSRFSQMLEAARIEQADSGMQSVSVLDRMIDSAIEFGLLQKNGKTENGQEIFVSGNLSDSIVEIKDENPKLLNVESTFSISLMPGLSLKRLLPFASFLNIKKCEVVTEFEITRQSVSVAFDEGWTPDSIFAELEKYTYYEMPQSLKMNIIDWYSSYTSAELYCGYVLKVSEKNVALVENNPKINSHIKQKIAEGIYLLDIPVNFDIKDFINESGIDFLGNVRTSGRPKHETSFPLMRNGEKLRLLNNMGEAKSFEVGSFENGCNLIGNLKQRLETMDLSQNQKECLAYRISNRLILSEEQLSIVAIRNEILEASGTDFSGKVHLIEAAIKEEDMMEIKMPDAKSGTEYFTILGKPLILSKQPADAVVSFKIEPTGEVENLVVSRITHARRLRF